MLHQCLRFECDIFTPHRTRTLINNSMTYYTVYKVTNKINGKFYIGTHKTKNLNDGYMGSGKYLLRSIEKHGLENFEKEILFVYDNADEMFAKEAEIVNADFLAEENTYNLKIGGFGGWDHISSDAMADRNRKIAANRDYNDPDYLNTLRDIFKRRISRKSSSKPQENHSRAIRKRPSSWLVVSRQATHRRSKKKNR